MDAFVDVFRRGSSPQAACAIRFHAQFIMLLHKICLVYLPSVRLLSWAVSILEMLSVLFYLLLHRISNTVMSPR